MRVLVAPQEFKGSLTAVEAAEAIARGAHRADPSAEVDVLPLSDGGPGFLAALHAALSSTLVEFDARDPLRRPVRASILDAGETVFVEAAEANGLWRLQEAERDPLYAGTEGVGDLLLAAAGCAPNRIVVGVGGSATNDGGAGMARVLGARFTAMDGSELAPGAAPLGELMRIDWERPAQFQGIDVVVATDVRNPLLGPEGAASVFGPQKGATPEQVDIIESALYRYAQVVRRSLGADVANKPGAGAAGGLGAGLIAFLGARVQSGFDVVADAVDLVDHIRDSDLVITGEGSYDAQSAMGKVTHRVQQLARDQGRECLVLAGRTDDASAHVQTIASIANDESDAMSRSAELLEELAARAIRGR
jgi:glycerate 2-kinase